MAERSGRTVSAASQHRNAADSVPPTRGDRAWAVSFLSRDNWIDAHPKGSLSSFPCTRGRRSDAAATAEVVEMEGGVGGRCVQKADLLR